jgi:hypothetical protein
MDAEEFVTLAGKVAGMGKAGARSAVSRAYYGAFHFAISILDELATAPASNGKGHNLVPIFLKSCNHPDAQSAADLLSDLHSDRIKADYHIADNRFEGLTFAQNDVENAETIKALLQRFRTACVADESLRRNLRDGVNRVKASFKA